MAITFTVLLCLSEFWGGWGQTPVWEEISLEIDELKVSGKVGICSGVSGRSPGSLFQGCV